MRKKPGKSSHLSPSQRREKFEAIKKQENDPTVDYTDYELDFEGSDEPSETEERPDKDDVRGPDGIEKIKRHFIDNWSGWIFTLIGFFGLYFMYESQVADAEQNVKIEYIERDVEENKSDIEILKDETSSQKFDIELNKRDLNDLKEKTE